MKTKSSVKPVSQKDSSALQELFIDSLKDIYWAEKHLVKALPKLATASTSKELKAAFEQHTTETEVHVQRLEQVFELIGKKAVAKKCEAMEGLLKESDSIPRGYGERHARTGLRLSFSSSESRALRNR